MTDPRHCSCAVLGISPCRHRGGAAPRGSPCACAACPDCAVPDGPGPAYSVVPGLPGHFNASLHEFGGRLLLASRVGWAGSRVHLTEVAADLTPAGPPRVLRLDHPRCTYGQEDPRLFTHRGRLHLSFTGVEKAGGQILTHVLFADLGDGTDAPRVWAPQYERRTYPREKNWVGFSSGGEELLAVYSVEPHTVVAAGGPWAEVVAHTAAGLSWKYGHMRGGAAPVRLGGEWYHWFHGNRPPAMPGGRFLYTVGLYTFDPRPPYRVLRFAAEPLAWGDPAEENEHNGGASVVFPGGAVLRNGEWLVSAGWMDRAVRVYRFPAAGVEARLRPVGRADIAAGGAAGA